MICIFGGQQFLMLPVEVDAVIMSKIWILTFFLSSCQKIENAILFVYVKHLGHWAITMCDLVFHFARGEVVKIHLTPIATLGVPEEFVRARQVSPVHFALS